MFLLLLPYAHGHVVVVAFVAEVVVAARILIRGAGHRRGLGNGLVHLHYEVSQHRIAETERTRELGEGLLIALDVEQDVVRFVNFGNGEGQLAPAPVLETMHRAAAGTDHAFVAIDHRRNLLALVRVDQEHDFIMPHCRLPTGKPPVASGEARSKAGQPAKKEREGYAFRPLKVKSSAAAGPRTGRLRRPPTH